MTGAAIPLADRIMFGSIGLMMIGFVAGSIIERQRVNSESEAIIPSIMLGGDFWVSCHNPPLTLRGNLVFCSGKKTIEVHCAGGVPCVTVVTGWGTVVTCPRPSKSREI